MGLGFPTDMIKPVVNTPAGKLLDKAAAPAVKFAKKRLRKILLSDDEEVKNRAGRTSVFGDILEA